MFEKGRMRAMQYTRYGLPEVVHLAEVPIPKPASDEILIKIHTSTVNRTDCGFRSAEYFVSRFFSGLWRPKNKILGCEFSGEIVEIGAEVKEFKNGELVFGYDDSNFGGHAEYKKIKSTDGVAKVPPGYDLAKAAALTEGAHYALCNIRAAGVKQGHQVLVNGGTGAIGSAAFQLIRHFGAEVTVVCGTEYVDLVRQLGANHVIDYQKNDFTTLGGSFDFIFDAVGKSSFHRCKPLLHKKGIYISTELGKNGINPLLAITTSLTGGKRVLFPIPSINKEDVTWLGQLAAEGAFVPLIDRTFPLEQIVEAYHYVETGMKTGNVLVSINQMQ